MMLHAYYYAGYWAYDFDKYELDNYLPRLQKHFEKYNMRTELLGKDSTTEEYLNYVTFLKEVCKSHKYEEETEKIFVEDDDRIILDGKLYEIEKILQRKNKYDKVFIEWGSYIMCDCPEVLTHLYDEQKDNNEKEEKNKIAQKNIMNRRLTL